MNEATDKKDFALMMRVLWQNYGKRECESVTMRYWFDKLSNHNLQDVGNAIDRWMISNDEKLPSIKDILDSLKPKEPVHKALPRPNNKESNQAFAKNVVEFVAENTKKKTDYKAWAKRIVANPSMYPEISLKMANEALAA